MNYTVCFGVFPGLEGLGLRVWDYEFYSLVLIG